jgi:hypothetical protein
MSQPSDPEFLREWMFGFLVEHSGDDCAYHNILERDLSRSDELLPLNGPERDRAEIFRELVASLTELLGSEKAAADWLMHSAMFDKFGGATPIEYLQEGGFWTLSLMNDALKIAEAHPADPLGLRAELGLSAWGSEKDLEAHLDLIPTAWDFDDATFESILGVSAGYLDLWRRHEIKVSAKDRQAIRRVLLFHESLRLHVRPRGYAAWWRRPWAEESCIGSRSPLQVWIEDGWDGLDFIKRVFWGQQS